MFEVGDEVYVERVDSRWTYYIGNLHEFVGNIGRVISIGERAVRLKFECGTSWNFDPNWLKKVVRVVEGEEEGSAPEYTGGSVSYYTVRVENPTTPGVDAYDAECNDIIEALDMNYAEGNAFKAIWRRAAARKGLKKKGYTDGLYDAEKVVFFGQRMVVQEKANASED